MKKLLVIGWLAAGAVAAHAQGTVFFSNVGGLIPAGQAGPIMHEGYRPGTPGSPLIGSGPASGAAFLAQLQVKLDGTWTDVGTPSPFRTGAAAGYWQAAEVSIPGVAGGETATLRVVAYVAEHGSSSAALSSWWGGVGTSWDLTVILGGAGDPPTPAAQLTTLTPFFIRFIPEPSMASLGLLGAGLLMICRRKESIVVG